MPDIDLEPSHYAERDPNSGKWRRPLSKKAARGWFIFFAVFLVVILLNPTSISIFLAAFLAFGAGVFAQQWLRDLY